jgi:drug/metabolite transporter (DMT)-like permease
MRPSDAARMGLLAAIWGSSFLLIKFALADLSPLQIVGGRIVLGALTLAVIVRARSLRLPRDATTWAGLAFMAIVANVLPFTLITWGEERISSGLTAILNSATPLFTVAFAAALLPAERSSLRRLAGIALGFGGVVLIVGLGGRPGRITEQLAVLLAAASYGAGFVFARKYLSGRTQDPLTIPAGQLVVAAGVMIPLVGVEAGLRPPPYGLSSALSVVVLGVFGTGIAFYLYYRLVADVGATTASFVTYLLPVVGATLGWLVRGERLGGTELLGAALVIAGITIAERAKGEPASGRGDAAEAAFSLSESR